MLRRWISSLKGFSGSQWISHEEAYFTNIMWMFFGETKETGQDIRECSIRSER